MNLDRGTLSGILLGLLGVIGILLIHATHVTSNGPGYIIPITMMILTAAVVYFYRVRQTMLSGIALTFIGFLAWILSSVFNDIPSWVEYTWLPVAYVVFTIGLMFLYRQSNYHEDQLDSQQQKPKQKRKQQSPSTNEEMRLLIEMMDEDERFAFKETLKERIYARYDGLDDGELNFDAFEDDANDYQYEIR